MEFLDFAQSVFFVVVGFMFLTLNWLFFCKTKKIYRENVIITNIFFSGVEGMSTISTNLIPLLMADCEVLSFPWIRSFNSNFWNGFQKKKKKTSPIAHHAGFSAVQDFCSGPTIFSFKLHQYPSIFLHGPTMNGSWLDYGYPHQTC